MIEQCQCLIPSINKNIVPTHGSAVVHDLPRGKGNPQSQFDSDETPGRLVYKRRNKRGQQGNLQVQVASAENQYSMDVKRDAQKGTDGLKQLGQAGNSVKEKGQE